jgi:asparagine synthase (glutamine-hydrolysing)
MAAAVRHRGPDGYGFLVGPELGLAHVRLSIIDLKCGMQPMQTIDGEFAIVYNGEVYNYVELREELEKLGHRFRTTSDTEVLLEAWREWGPSALDRFNGQFAFALYDKGRQSLFLARDRFGVRPLYYFHDGRTFVFGSECKAIFASGIVQPAPDLQGLDEVATFWAPRGSRTPFAGVSQLEPGHWAELRNGRMSIHRWWSPTYSASDEEPKDALDILEDLLVSAVSLRMRADVPVGAYLSGGLDSSITSVLAARTTDRPLHTFSVAFDDPSLDERSHQELVAREVGSRHHMELALHTNIADVFARVVQHAEVPVVRTAPAPMFMLAERVKRDGIKVVLTGEGSDEIFLGYDIFKETMVRRFCLRRPNSTMRPRLFDRLYPYLGHERRAGELWQRFFLEAAEASDPLFSHMPRVLMTSRTKEFYSRDVRAALAGVDVLDEWRQSLPQAFYGLSDLERAAFLEVTVLLPSYLLSTQGDRMSLAHGVEGRYPFLDHRLFAFAASLPERSRLSGLQEKEILRRWSRKRLPPSIVSRHKQPYRAPDASAFFGNGMHQWVDDMLSNDAVRRVGLFDPQAVDGLVRRCRAGKTVSFRENQALVAVLSGQLWHDHFLRAGRSDPDPLPVDGADVMLFDGLTGGGPTEGR